MAPRAKLKGKRISHCLGLCPSQRSTLIYHETISFMTETESKLRVFRIEAPSSRTEQTPLNPAVTGLWIPLSRLKMEISLLKKGKYLSEHVSHAYCLWIHLSRLKMAAPVERRGRTLKCKTGRS